MDEGMRGKKKRLSHHYGTDFKQISEAEVKDFFRIKSKKVYFILK